MSTLNKIYYGSAGTGKTREATIEAVKVVNEKLNMNFDINKCDKDFKSYSGFKNNKFFGTYTKEQDKELNRQLIDVDFDKNTIINNANFRKMLTDEYENKEKTAKIIQENRAYPFIETVTFHPSYSYQDFVEGITIDTVEIKKDGKSVKEIVYRVKDGIFKKICDRAKANEEYNYVLIIDEINRGDISSIFGELFTLLEDNRREGKSEELSINLPYSKDEKNNPKKLTVPSNLYIIATMNTVDKSIALIDVALRRRFDFIEMKPKPELLRSIKIENIDLVQMLKVINERITILKNEHYQIGHSYFLKDINSFEDLKRVMTKNIIPLLQEYFYDDWQSICAVLNQPYEKSTQNEGLFNIKKADDSMFSHEFKDLIEFNNKRIVTIREFNEHDIKTIY